MSALPPLRPRRRAARGALPVAVAGVVGAIMLSLSFSPSFAALTASITNSFNEVGMGALVIQESNAAGDIICASSGTAVTTNSATINKYGGNLNMVPGQTVSTTVKIKKSGLAR